MNDIQTFLDMTLWGDTIRTYLVVLLVITAIFLFFRFFFRILFGKLEKYAAKTKTDLDDAVFKMLEYNRWIIFAALASIYTGLALELTPRFESIINNIALVITVLLGIRVINFWIEYAFNKAGRYKNEAAEQFTIRLLGRVAKIFIWIVGVLFLISSFGYNITSLVAGLGIGGIAIALAIQSILGDLISCISIYLDKPFQVGDFIVLGDKMGTVSNIGLKTTRIMSLHGEEIVISNKKLTESDIQNFGRMRQRRVAFNLSVDYKTPLKKMKQIPAKLQKIIESVDNTQFDHAHFKHFGESAKVFEVVFFVKTKEHNTYLDILQEVNFRIQQYFEKEKVQFALPSRNIYLRK